MLFLPQGHVVTGFSGSGYRPSTHSTVSSLLHSNPGATIDLNKISLGLSYQFESKIKEAWAGDMSHSRYNLKYPQSVVVAVPVKNLRIAFGMTQLYNNEIDYGTIQGMTVWNNEQGYLGGEDVNPSKIEYILKTSGALSFKHKVGNNYELSIGFQYNDNHLYYIFYPGHPQSIDTLLSYVKEFDMSKSNYSYGFILNQSGQLFPKVRVGLYYENGIKFEKDVLSGILRNRFIGEVPNKIHAGVYLQLNPKWSISSNFSNIFWNKISIQNVKATKELSINIGYQLKDHVQLTWGIFSTNYLIDNINNLFYNNNMNALYIIAGSKLLFKPWDFDISIADSHLSSDIKRKHTIFKIEFGYSLR